MSDGTPVILDTDLGSDVDDAMALSVLLGTKTVNLIAVTTVYGDTLLRARIARRYGHLAHRDLLVYPGRTNPMSGREVWWAGIEGTLHSDLERETVEHLDAVTRLTEAAREHPGEVDIIAIGPLTNIAAAIDADPEFAANVHHLYIMGGSFYGTSGFDGTGIEHNFRSDDIAAARVFAAGIPATVTGLDVTQQLKFSAADLKRIEGAGDLGGALMADIRQWWAYWGQEWNVPHDPVAALTLLAPALFERSEPGSVYITCGGPDAGRSRFDPDPAGTTRLVTDLNVRTVTDQIVERINCSATGHKPAEQVRQ